MVCKNMCGGEEGRVIGRCGGDTLMTISIQNTLLVYSFLVPVKSTKMNAEPKRHKRDQLNNDVMLVKMHIILYLYLHEILHRI